MVFYTTVKSGLNFVKELYINDLNIGELCENRRKRGSTFVVHVDESTCTCVT